MMNTNKKIPIDSLEDEIDAIRIQLYEQTKDMTDAEQIEFFNKGARDIMGKQGLTNVKFASSANDAPTSQP